jgi:hypothetical protein
MIMLGGLAIEYSVIESIGPVDTHENIHSCIIMSSGQTIKYYASDRRTHRQIFIACIIMSGGQVIEYSDVVCIGPADRQANIYCIFNNVRRTGD